MATATLPRSRSGSIDQDGRPTYVNFSTPQRTLSMRSDTSSKWREHPEPKSLVDRDESNSGEDEVLPYRPVKHKLVQLHVTSSVNSLPASSRPSFSNTARPSRNASRPSIDNNNARPNLDDTQKVLIPTRTTSLHRHEKPNKKWPGNVRPPPPSPQGSYRFQTAPTLVRTPWEIERGRPGSRWSRTSHRASTLPAHIFRELPREIYQCILDHVEAVHTQGTLLDVPSSRADLRALCLVDRRWHRVAREGLYRELWIPSNKPSGKRKLLRQPKKSKLKLLLHTLCTSPGMAFLVFHMHITSGLADELAAEPNAGPKKESVTEAVQQMIRQCYNLERVTGYISEATTTTFPFFQALATRTRLRAHAWYLDSSKVLPNLGAFINCHDQWVNLESLVIAADPDVDLGKVAVSAVVSRLPSLKHLMLSGLHSEDFHNGSLLALPTLKTLRLELLDGVTDQGIQQLAYSRLAPSLEKLSLVGLELASLETVQTLLLHLTAMRSFVFVQDTSPEPQLGLGAVNKFNLLASTSLQYLHWDCLVPGNAVSRFAQAITEGRFPRLLKVKIPCDFDGAIQLLCRPIPRMKLTQSDIDYFKAHLGEKRYERRLRVSQIQAQLRIRESRRTPSFSLIVQDEANEVQFNHTIGAFIGKMGSKIEYCLDPDVDTAALAEFREVQRPRKSGRENMERRVDMMALF